MINLHEESIYLQGARNLLMQLQNGFAMYLIPSVKCKCKSKNPFIDELSGEKYDYFPLNNTNMRKLVGDGLMNALLYDRESLVKFLSGDYDSLQVEKIERDKKGKITKLKIKVI